MTNRRQFLQTAVVASLSGAAFGVSASNVCDKPAK